ncbi:unnamed protein product [Colias eurytheme]|nr:unnamed protein product [Colias eurytheme]
MMLGGMDGKEYGALHAAAAAAGYAMETDWWCGSTKPHIRVQCNEPLVKNFTPTKHNIWTGCCFKMAAESRANATERVSTNIGASLLRVIHLLAISWDNYLEIFRLGHVNFGPWEGAVGYVGFLATKTPTSSRFNDEAARCL